MKNLFHNRWVRVLAWMAVSLITLYALVAAFIGWTGASMWRDAQARLKAAGETTDFRAVLAEPVPDEQNFCAIPALKDIALEVDGDSDKGEPGARRKRLEALRFPSGDTAKDKPALPRGAAFGERVNLEAWRDWLRKTGVAKGTTNSGNAGRDVLDLLSASDAIVAELVGGLDRPAAHWTPPWKTRELPKILFAIALPHYKAVQGMSQHFGLRASAAARAGDVAQAHESLQVMAKLNEATTNDPFLIGLLVAASNHAHMTAAVWEACDAQAGSAADFGKLESALSAADYRRAGIQAYRGELAAVIDAVRFMNQSGDFSMLAMMYDSGGSPGSIERSMISRLVPSGFLNGTCAVIVEHEFDHMIKPLKDEGWAAAIRSGQVSEGRLQEARKHFYLHPFHIIASLVVPATNSVNIRAAYTQCLVDQATIACAMERHRIKKGAYPDSLTDLMLANGKPLPMDALSGKPMGYRKTDNGKYALWCVGFDGKDDGGRRVLDATKPEGTKFGDKNYKGDWVWDYPSAK